MDFKKILKDKPKLNQLFAQSRKIHILMQMSNPAVRDEIWAK